MSLSPCSTDPFSLWYAVLPSYFLSVISLLGNSFATDSASLGKLTRGQNIGHSRGIYIYFFFNFTFLDLHVHKYN